MIRQQAAPGCQIFCAVNERYFTGNPLVFIPTIRSGMSEMRICTIWHPLRKSLPPCRLLCNLPAEKSSTLRGPWELFSEVRGTNKEKLILEDILAHQAGLEAWIRFYTLTLQPLIPQKPLFSKIWSEEYPFGLRRTFTFFSCGL